jgi:hypothetical protein
MPDTPSPLDLAHTLAAVGWHVFPIAPNTKRPLANCPACRDQAGRPAHPIDACPCLPQGGWCHGVRAATIDPHCITRWWTDQPTAAVAIAAGPSGLLLIDIDTHGAQPPAGPARDLLPGIDLAREPNPPAGWDDPTRYRDGRDALRLLAQLRGGAYPWPTDPGRQPVAVDTPSGGRHLWYRAPTSTLHQAIHPRGLTWQVDIKAGWSYGLAPGTTTTAGTYHHRGGNLAQPGYPPTWLAREVIRAAGPPPTPPTPAPRPAGTGPAGYLDTLLARGAEHIRTLTDGRKAALAALAYKTGGYLAWAGLTDTDVIDRLITAGTTAGLTYPTAERTARRSLTNGQNRPLIPKRRV